MSYNYGFSGDVGGGPYDRRAEFEGLMNGREPTTQVSVAKHPPATGSTVFHTSLTDAVAAWHNDSTPKKFWVIRIADNCTYRESLIGPDQIQVPEGSRLVIICTESTVQSSTSTRPHLLGDISVKGTAPDTDLSPGEMVVDGLLIEGNVRVLDGNLGGLVLSHTTVVPGRGDIVVNDTNEALQLEIYRSVCGLLRVHSAIRLLSVEESIVDGWNLKAIIANDSPTKLVRSTIFGGVEVLRIDADTVIVTDRSHPDTPGVDDRVIAVRRQVGCVRFSYIPPDSVVPRRYRCQPALALKERARELNLDSTSDLNATQVQRIQARQKPLFTSIEYGHPGYAQLAETSVPEIHTGGENGAEMGAFNFLLQPQRKANLEQSMPDFLRFGLEAGIFFVT